jgi:hypothetical protein
MDGNESTFSVYYQFQKKDNFRRMFTENFSLIVHPQFFN